MAVDMPVEVQALIEHLIQIASEHEIIVAGFAFPRKCGYIVNFGNCTDHGDPELYKELCRLRGNSEENGSIIRQEVKKVN